MDLSATKTVISALIVGIGPLVYIANKESNLEVKKDNFGPSASFSPMEIDTSNLKTWECQFKKFEKSDLQLVIPNSPFFKIVHCYKEDQYDWQMFLPKFLFESTKLDESKNLNLTSQERITNLNAIKMVQKENSLFKSWLFMRKINSYNASRRLGEEIKYSSLFEFEIVNFQKKRMKAWVTI